MKMTKQLKFRIRSIGLATLIGAVLWFVYDVHFKFVINSYQAKQIEKQLEENFRNKKDGFNDFFALTQGIGILENVTFGEDEKVNFQFDIGSFDGGYEERFSIILGDEIYCGIQDIVFSDSNRIFLYLEDTVVSKENCTIFFRGTKQDPFIEKLLAYSGTSLQQLNVIEQKLKEINCIGFGKNRNLLTIRYRGHWGESYNYVRPLKEGLIPGNSYQLENNFYWEHFEFGLFCGWTDW